MTTEELWNDYHEDLLQNWSEMSKTYTIMHSLCANHYAKIDKLLGIPVIILGAITASSIFGTTNYNDKEHFYLNYINGGLALVITALTGVNKFLGSAEKRIKHQTASFKYTSISMNIDTMLSFSRDKRRCDPQDFASEQKRKILEIRENCPEVIPKIMSSYLNKYDKSLVNIDTTVNKSVSKLIPHNKVKNKESRITINDKSITSPLKFTDDQSKTIEVARNALKKSKRDKDKGNM